MIDLQTVWFLLVGMLLTGYAILDGFDLGVGMMHLFIAKSDHDRRVLVNSIGPVWDGNEVWLLTGGGAIFAAFPNVYATVFSGFYIALMLLLAALIVRAVSLEFRSKVESPRWRQSWDVAFAGGSMLPSLLFGVAIGNVVRGVPIGADGEYAGSFFTLLNPFAILAGVLMVPALGEAANSLTIYNASSSNRTLVTMLVIALAGMPVVIGYTIFIYRRFMHPVVLDEHSY